MNKVEILMETISLTVRRDELMKRYITLLTKVPHSPETKAELYEINEEMGRMVERLKVLLIETEKIKAKERGEIQHTDNDYLINPD